jgi:hypothetical protein
LWPRDREPTVQAVAILTTELAAAEGQQTVLDRDGVVLTLVGPGTATITHGDPAGVRIAVARGTLIADRRADAPSLIVSAAGTTTTTRDPRFAVRVQQGMVVFGAGDNARAIVERHQVELAPKPARPIESAPPPPKPVAAVEAKPAPKPAVPAEPTELPATLLEIKVEAKELYLRAEAALRIDDPEAARLLLLRILDEHPSSALVDPARYDLARIAFTKRDATTAMLYINQILQSGTDAAMRRAAEKLRDRIARESQ